MNSQSGSVKTRGVTVRTWDGTANQLLAWVDGVAGSSVQLTIGKESGGTAEVVRARVTLPSGQRVTLTQTDRNVVIDGGSVSVLSDADLAAAFDVVP